jgi:predicted phage tail protein
MDAETRAAIEICLRGVLAEELGTAIELALERRDQALGIPTSKEDVDAFRRNLEFSGFMRRAFNGAALAVGQSILGAAVVGAFLLAAIALKSDHFK